MSRWVSRRTKCPTCKGEKIVQNEDKEWVTCPTCGGKGTIIRPSMM